MKAGVISVADEQEKVADAVGSADEHEVSAKPPERDDDLTFDEAIDEQETPELDA